MSTLETILARAMNETDFAKQLFEDPDHALMGYDLTPEEIAQFQGLSHIEFDEAVTNPEARKSFSLLGEGKKVRIDFCKTDNGW